MKSDRGQLKAELMAQAEEVIDELLDWCEGEEGPTFSEIEEVVLRLRRRMGERMAEAVVREGEEVRPVVDP